MSDTIYSPRTLKVRIDRSLSYGDRVKLETMSNEHRLLYNHLLEQTQGEIGSDFKKLNKEYARFRHENKLTIPSKAAQNTCYSLINNMKSFFALKKKDATAKFPHKFKSWKFFTSFTYDWNGGGGGFYFTPTELVIRKPEIRIRLPEHVTLNLEDIRTVTFSGNEKGHIFISFMHYVGTPNRHLSRDNWLSLDPGVTSILTGVTSTGVFFKVKNEDGRIDEKQVDALRGRRDRKKRGSKRRLKAAAAFRRKSAKVMNRRRDYHHKLTKSVIDFCIENDIGTIIHGDIQTKKLKDAKGANRGLNRATQNRGTLSRVKQFLAYKAEKEGIAHVLQDEAYTSKTNCYTKELFPNMSLGVREVELVPGLLIDRDVNGAINIANKNLGNWSPQWAWLTGLRDTPLLVCE